MKKFEFILSINGNIICQRYFSVKNFNPKVLRSVDLTECVEECVRLIQKDLKNKTYEYMYNSYNPYRKQLQEDIMVENIYDNEDVFDFEIKMDERTIIKKRFTGNVYPQRVRYSVDVRKIIPSIIKEIQETFYLQIFDVEYSGIVL
tara:strand:- start:64 stop:501 length:438 start_codon:yes stop_codon:yes gene_type:complete